jgi:hypothetical protein
MGSSVWLYSKKSSYSFVSGDSADKAKVGLS